MSQFAAGCAVCGYDLEAARREAAGRDPTVVDRLADVRPGWIRLPLARQDMLVVAMTVALVIFFPLIGLALAGWTAYDRNRNGDAWMRNVALALVVVAAVLLAMPELRYGIVFTLSG